MVTYQDQNFDFDCLQRADLLRRIVCILARRVTSRKHTLSEYFGRLCGQKTRAYLDAQLKRCLPVVDNTKPADETRINVVACNHGDVLC